jgi:hypothetical protein
MDVFIYQKNVHKRITVFSKQGQGENKQMFVFNYLPLQEMDEKIKSMTN